ncbi:hypothetical protein MsAg5_03960 [Methanosarcinaceae archaeon Ag5]|uniref:TldD/PmbA family protein n=1 Tax=Methanolapillus africanus TaxID=3028297 RepID=A0AAE4MIB8_9EURY|nr:hypothetical protein [Methanosarcinaceae archaeon Ag5]
MDCILDAERDEEQVFGSVMDDIEKALALAQKLGAKDAEIIYSMKRATMINFKKDIIETARCSTNTGYGVRAVVNGAVGFSGTNVRSSLTDCVKNAVGSAKVMDPDPFFKSLPEKADYTPVAGLFDDRIIRMPLEECIDNTMEMISGAKAVSGVEPTSGSFSRSISHVLIMNTNGVFAKKKGTGMSGYIDVVAESGLGYENLATAYDYEVSRSKDIDFFKIGQTAADLSQ